MLLLLNDFLIFGCWLFVLIFISIFPRRALALALVIVLIARSLRQH